MSRSILWVLVVVTGMALGSCAQPDQTGPTSAVAATDPRPATTTTDPGAPVADRASVEAYLVEMTNLDAALQDKLFEYEYEHTGLEPVDAVEEPEQPPEITEEERFADEQSYWLGYFDRYLEHADVLESVIPPPGFETAHRHHLDSFRDYYAYVRDQVAGFSTMADFEAFFRSVFDPLAEPPPREHQELYLSLVEACRSLEEAGERAGFESDLGCPSPPPEPVAVSVEVGDTWAAEPNPAPVGDGLVRMLITNTGAEAIQPVVLTIFEGEPLDLPVVDGVVDIWRSGFFETGSGYASIGLSYAGTEEVLGGEFGVVGEPEELKPGETVEAVVWSDGPMVVFDYRPGQFEAGAVVVIERTSP